MKRLSLIICGLVLIVGLVYAQQDSEQPETATGTITEKGSRISYTLGATLGRQAQGAGFPINPQLIIKGFSDVVLGQQLQMTTEQMQQTLDEMRQEIATRQREAAIKHHEAGAKFMANNGKKEGVVTLASGLQYAIVKEGDGASPKATDRVSVHYRGTLIDGREFDSSHRRGTPASFTLNKVIPGWTEALQLMKVGDTWNIFIPPNLAYGETGRPGIPPNSTLVFEIELLEIAGP